LPGVASFASLWANQQQLGAAMAAIMLAGPFIMRHMCSSMCFKPCTIT
jgi:hypothetical protein